MPKKYNVQVGYEVFHVAWVEVEAENETQAQERAVQKAGDSTLEYEPDPYDEGGNLQALQVEEIEPCDE